MCGYRLPTLGQIRQDRDDFVTVHWSAIQSGQSFNFDKADPLRSFDYKDYDYSSIMHYGTDFAARGSSPTLSVRSSAYAAWLASTASAGSPDFDGIGSQRGGLSRQDVAGFHHNYGDGTTCIDNTDAAKGVASSESLQ